jgi:hypothetical protein
VKGRGWGFAHGVRFVAAFTEDEGAMKERCVGGVGGVGGTP